MSEINDGGQVFLWGEHGQILGGMTLRDYFAAKALPGICAHHDTWGLTSKEICQTSYRLADEMLKARGQS